MGSHSFCANLTHFEVGSHSSEAADLDRSARNTYSHHASRTLCMCICDLTTCLRVSDLEFESVELRKVCLTVRLHSYVAALALKAPLACTLAFGYMILL